MLEWSGMINNYNNTEECNPARKKRKASIVFADSIVDIINNGKHHQTVTKLSIRKLKVSLVFILQSYSALKDVLLNILHFFVTKIANRREVQQIGINHSS